MCVRVCARVCVCVKGPQEIDLAGGQNHPDAIEKRTLKQYLSMIRGRPGKYEAREMRER